MSIYLYQPAGIGSLPETIRSQDSGLYILRYNSPSFSNFGNEYIPLEVECRLIRKSGRDEAGYYGPLEF
ncbi:MAG: hypothetical protein ACLFR1_08790 [Spirochaetia bacterium]